MSRRTDKARGKGGVRRDGARGARAARSAFGLDVLRTVRGSLKRFVALATITALGVTMLVGLRAACVDLRSSADAFFDEQGLFDVRVQSTLGLTDEDVEALAELPGVEAAEGGWSETVYTTVGSTSEKVDVKALSSDGMNEPVVLEGHLPERDDQIAVTRRFLEDSGLCLGDTVTFQGADDGAEDATEVFARKEYTIIAVVLDPTEINAGEGTMSFRSSGGSQYSFFVLSDCVNDPETFTVAYLSVEGADAPLCYSGEYEDIVDEVYQSVEDARAERERARGCARTPRPRLTRRSQRRSRSLPTRRPRLTTDRGSLTATVRSSANRRTPPIASLPTRSPRSTTGTLSSTRRRRSSTSGAHRSRAALSRSPPA